MSHPLATAIVYAIAGVCIVLVLRYAVRQLKGLDDHLTELLDLEPEDPQP